VRDSDPNDRDVVSVCGQSEQIARIRGENGTCRLSESDDESVDSGAVTSEPSECCGASSEILRDVFGDVAGLEKTIFDGVPSGMALEALDENDGRHKRRPKSLVAQCENECGRVARAFSEARYGAGVEDENQVSRPCDAAWR
jgi:hypothetical protein